MTRVAFRMLLCVMLPALTAGAQQVSTEELRTMLGAFAHDSTLGRRTGTPSQVKATDFIIAELRRLGVRGAGDGGGYTQDVPIVRKQLDLARARAFDNGPYLPGIDFVPLTGTFGLATPDSASVGRSTYIAGGRIGAPTALAPSQSAGKFIVFEPPRRSSGHSDYQLWNVREALASYHGAAALFVVTFDLMPQAFIDELSRPRFELRDRVAVLPRTPPIIAITRGVAQKSFQTHAAGPQYATRVLSLEAPTQNVVALVEGSDPQLRSEFVVLTAHADYLGVADPSERVVGDSIYNGANDAATGAVALLAIARELALRPTKSKRSVLFVWTVGWAQGLLGAEYFADHPPVQRGKMIASIDVSAIGHPGSADVVGGGPGYVRVSGAGRLSTEFVTLIESVNNRMAAPYAMDVTATAADMQPSPYCDGDHWHFARWGIPSASISTGPNAYSRHVRDDVSGVDFVAYERAIAFVRRIVEDVANRATAPRVDRPRPDPKTPCVR